MAALEFNPKPLHMHTHVPLLSFPCLHSLLHQRTREVKVEKGILASARAKSQEKGVMVVRETSPLDFTRVEMPYV